jgi:hypothetical protein
MWFGVIAVLMPLVVAVAGLKLTHARPDPDDLGPFVSL